MGMPCERNLKPHRCLYKCSQAPGTELPHDARVTGFPHPLTHSQPLRPQSLTKDVPEVELTRAKRAALGTVLSSLEGRAVVAEDIGRQLLTYGARRVSFAACCMAHCKSLNSKP